MREEEKKRFSKKSGLKRFLSKRWALPAIYLASAAILLVAVLWFQNSNEDTADSNDIQVQDHGSSGSNEESIEVGSKVENVMLPVDDADSVVVKTDFYDKTASKESQEKALIFYNNKYHMNRGIDLAMEDGKPFEVMAALSGTVTKVENDALLGNTIVIEHQNGITTHYQSVTDIAVEVGDEVVKGQVLAKAGKSTLNEEAGTHVHFEIRKEGTAVNPNTYIGKSVATILEDEAKEEKSAKTDEPVKEEADVEEEDLDSEHSTEEDSTEESIEQE